jgi:acyl-CoA reductase-like NAD-dependent aldehyde dehydrogenase
MGPVINKAAAARSRYERWCASCAKAAPSLVDAGARLLQDGALASGHYVRPGAGRGRPADHPLWRQELFLPLLMLQRVASRDEANAAGQRQAGTG